MFEFRDFCFQLSEIFQHFRRPQLGRNLASQPAESWHERELDGLSSFSGATVRVDAIDPADPNLKRPGPDGRVELTFSGDVTP